MGGTGGGGGVVLLAMGLLAAAAGLYGYLARTAPPKNIPNLNGFYGLLPAGLGVACIGAGSLLWGHHPTMDVLFTLGFALFVLGIALCFWHPRWIRPWWMKDESTWL